MKQLKKNTIGDNDTLTHCTKLEFDSFNPTTTTFKWVLSNDSRD